MNEDHEPKVSSLPLDALHVEDGVKDLLRSPNMRPYMRLAELMVSNRDVTPALKEIEQLPLEQRYLWRVVSALKWALCDLDDVSVRVDRDTLSREAVDKILELVRLRPMQFCIFLKALVGGEEMERQMVQAINVAKQAGKPQA